MTTLLPSRAQDRAPVLEPSTHGPARPGSRVAALLAVASVLAVLVASLLLGGGAPAPATPGLADAGAVVGWGQPVVQLLTRVLAVLVAGSLLVAALLVPAPGGLPAASLRAVRTAAAAAAAWAACEAVGLVLLTGALLGRPVVRLVPADVWAVVTALPAGRTVPAVVLLLAAVTVVGRTARTAGEARLLLLVALAAVVLPVLTTGHPAAAGDHAVTVAVLVVHVVTASLWVGGLAGVLLHLRRPVGTAAVAARQIAVGRFSGLALGCAAAVTGTGVAGALLLTDVPVPELLDSGYGALLLAKTAAVLLLVAAGWAHRRRTLPALSAGRPGAFVRIGVVETVLMAATLAVAVGLSSAPPPEPAPDLPAAAADPGATDLTSPTDVAPPTGVAPPAGSEPPAEGEPSLAGPSPAEDMAGHDHGELSVAVLVDEARLHMGAPVVAGAPVTVYNTGPGPVDLVADDGGFRATVPSRTFITFTAPGPGDHAFGDPSHPGFRDVLRVVPPPG